MAFVNPIKFCVVSVLSLFTLPLALLAGLTTFIAISVLLVRISLFYVDFLVSFLPTYVFGRHTYNRRLRTAKAAPVLAPSPSLSSTSPYARRRARRPSATSPISADAFAPATGHGLGLMAMPGMDRDFEGIGGWRDEGVDDDERWTSINSPFRIEEGPAFPGRNHHRTLSGGRIPRGGEYKPPASRRPGSSTPVSPNTSKVRRPQPNMAPPPFTTVGRDKFD